MKVRTLKHLITALIICVAFIIVLMLSIIVVTKRNENVDNNTISNDIFLIVNSVQDNTLSEAPTAVVNKKLRMIDDNSILYSISSNISAYFEYIRTHNSQAVKQLGGNNLYTVNGNSKFNVKLAYSTENNYMAKYYVYGVLTVANGDFTATQQEIYMIVYLTSENEGYTLQTISKEEFEDMKALEEDEKIDIEQGQYNVYKYEFINSIQLMQIYLDDFIFQMFNNTAKSYEMLNQEYREKRFGSLDAYVEYINEKQEQLRNIELFQYKVDDGDDNTVYRGTDKNGNFYYVKVTSPMEYEVILDSYTMDDYSNYNTNSKKEKSIEKFILMINNADYTNAYNLLDETFKENNFPTRDDFINYVKSNWFKRNLVREINILEDGSCNAIIQESISMSSNTIEKHFIVTLGDKMDFTIKFDV